MLNMLQQRCALFQKGKVFVGGWAMSSGINKNPPLLCWKEGSSKFNANVSGCKEWKAFKTEPSLRRAGRRAALSHKQSSTALFLFFV